MQLSSPLLNRSLEGNSISSAPEHKRLSYTAGSVRVVCVPPSFCSYFWSIPLLEKAYHSPLGLESILSNIMWLVSWGFVQIISKQSFIALKFRRKEWSELKCWDKPQYCMVLFSFWLIFIGGLFVILEFRLAPIMASEKKNQHKPLKMIAKFFNKGKWNSKLKVLPLSFKKVRWQ